MEVKSINDAIIITEKDKEMETKLCKYRTAETINKVLAELQGILVFDSSRDKIKDNLLSEAISCLESYLT